MIKENCLEQIVELLRGNIKLSTLNKKNQVLKDLIKEFPKLRVTWCGNITNDFRDFIINKPMIKKYIIEKLISDGLIKNERISYRDRIKVYVKQYYRKNCQYPTTEELYKIFIDIKSNSLRIYLLENLPNKLNNEFEDNQAKIISNKKKCIKCNQILDLNQFYTKGRNRKGYFSYCKKCFIKTTNINIWKKKKLAVDYITQKKGFGTSGKCFKCGINSLPLLEFHHEDSSNKEVSWQKLKKLSFYDIKPELDKCIILCRNCHLKVHAKFYYKHMDEILGNKIKDQLQNSIEEILPDNKRKCSKCHQILENNEFYLKKDKNRNKNLRHKICIECYKEMIQIRVWKKKKQAVNYVAFKEKNNNYGSCLKCGIEDLPVLEFHHRDDYKQNKEFGWSRLRKLSFKRIKEELDKCNIFCGNCHRNEHSKFYNKHEDEILSIDI